MTRDQNRLPDDSDVCPDFDLTSDMTQQHRSPICTSDDSNRAPSATISDYSDFDFGGYLNNDWDEHETLSEILASQHGADAPLLASAPSPIAAERRYTKALSPFGTDDASINGSLRTADSDATGGNNNPPPLFQQNVTHHPTSAEAHPNLSTRSIFASNTGTFRSARFFSRSPNEVAIVPSERFHCSLPFSFSPATASLPAPPEETETQSPSLGLAHLCNKCNRYYHSTEELNLHNLDHTLPNVCMQKGCTERFATSMELKQHKTSRHRSSLLWCPRAGCNRVEGGSGNPFTRTDNLTKHIRDVHDNKRIERERDDERSLTDGNLKMETLSPSAYEVEEGKTPKVDQSANKRRRMG